MAGLSWARLLYLLTLILERTALSKKPEQTIAAELEQLAKSDALKPCLLFKDPYVLDFLQLNDRYLEKDVEDAILRCLAKYEQEPGEASPLGIILCSGKKQEQIELLELDQTGIHVAEYLTELPPKAVLQQKLHDVIRSSRQRLGSDQLDSNQ